LEITQHKANEAQNVTELEARIQELESEKLELTDDLNSSRRDFEKELSVINQKLEFAEVKVTSEMKQREE